MGESADWVPHSSKGSRRAPGSGGAAGCACNQVGPLAGFYNYLWSSEVTGCVPWDGGTTVWTPRLGRAMAWALQSLLFGWGLRLCFPDWMVALAGLHAEEGCRQVFVLRQASGYALESNRLYRLCPKFGQSLRLHFTIR